MTRKIKRLWLSAHKEILILGLIVFVFSLLRLPSVIEPYWYGDEGIYQVIGRALREGRILYSEIWDNKPPLLYLIYAVFNGDQFYVRLASLFSGFFSVLIFFSIVKRIFKDKIAVFISTAFFAVSFGTPWLEGNIANAENFMVMPILASFYLLFVSVNKKDLIINAAAGLLVSAAFLTKIVALFDLLAFLTILLGLRFYETSLNRKDLFKEIKKFPAGYEREIAFILSFSLPIILTVLYFIPKGAASDFFRAAFSQNVGYVGYENFLLFPMGLLYLKLVILVIAIVLSFKFRSTLGRFGFAIFIWLFFSLFNSLFSGRPYTHYLLVALPSFSLFLGYILDNKRLLKFTLLIFVSVIMILNYNFKTYTKIIPYYQNYLSFVSGNKATSDFQNFFDGRTSSDYDIARFIKHKTDASDSVFLWGDNAQLYSLLGKLPPGRYAVSYHITFYNAIEETQQALAKTQPLYIIQTKDTSEISNFLAGYELRYKMEGATIYEREF